MGSTPGQKAIVIISLFVYVFLVGLNSFGGKRTDSPIFKILFNNHTIGEVSRVYHINITPARYAFSIWDLIYVWQAVWLLYSLSTVIRKTAPIVLPYSFYVGFMLSIAMQVVWSIVWTRLQPTGSFIALFINWIADVLTIAISYIVVERYTPKLETKPVDLLCLHVLVQNGLATLTSWTTIATCINLAVMLVYDYSVSQTTACCAALSLLFVFALVYYIIENVIYPHAFRTTFAPWLVLVWALVASLLKNFNSALPESIYTVVLLAVTCVLIVVRLALLIFRPSQGSKVDELNVRLF